MENEDSFADHISQEVTEYPYPDSTQIEYLQIPIRIARDYNTLEDVELGQTVIYERSSKSRTVFRIFFFILIILIYNYVGNKIQPLVIDYAEHYDKLMLEVYNSSYPNQVVEDEYMCFYEKNSILPDHLGIQNEDGALSCDDCDNVPVEIFATKEHSLNVFHNLSCPSYGFEYTFFLKEKMYTSIFDEYLEESINGFSDNSPDNENTGDLGFASVNIDHFQEKSSASIHMQDLPITDTSD
ncbi:unnamed protein product [Adineta ricciae]|uniref:Uncharacterized protein n=1 Tax=Adineta ricciae TaxID=249248 RepID=A0A813VTW0_ADIRI|nr:unnamed protein product [Adineta ricciae]